ncbi:hypothetical protein LTR86_001707 [Recurvomyces mirabilis]|nr:hypothetical protein LTR86_001707 [Recurvomyces mirabilis]
MPAKKGKNSSNKTAVADKTTFNVLVTGFDTWSGHPNEPNPSQLITADLARKIEIKQPGNATINVSVHFSNEPVPVSFAGIDTLVPKLYEAKRYDFVIHTGVAPSIKWYEIETTARRSGYKTKTDFGEMPPGEEHPGYGGREGPLKFYTCVLELGVETVLKSGKGQCTLKDADLRISRDAGLFVCEYITYASLAYLRYNKNHLLPPDEQTGVAFLHAPANGSEEMVRRGKEVYIALIKALILSKLGH